MTNPDDSETDNRPRRPHPMDVLIVVLLALLLVFAVWSVRADNGGCFAWGKKGEIATCRVHRR